MTQANYYPAQVRKLCFEEYMQDWEHERYATRITSNDLRRVLTALKLIQSEANPELLAILDKESS